MQMTPEELAAQLRCPHGQDAREVGERMNAANRALTLRAIALLEIAPGECVLEIGPGNAAFAPVVLADPGVRYVGLDLSAAMIDAAHDRHRDAIERGRARFIQGDARAMPFADAGIDRVLAVNTLYFWEAPLQVLGEIARVLRTDGVLCLAFADAGFMRDMPFAAHGFALHEVAAVVAMMRGAGFGAVDHHVHTERVRSNAGIEVDRPSHLLVGRRAYRRE